MARFMVIKVAISRKNIEIWRVLWGGDKKKKRDCASSWWAKMDSNHRRRKPADLQSAPFGHSGIYPVLTDSLLDVTPIGFKPITF